MTELECLVAAQTGGLAMTLARKDSGLLIIYVGKTPVPDNVLVVTLTNKTRAALRLRGGAVPARRGINTEPSTLFLFLVPLLGNQDLDRIKIEDGWALRADEIEGRKYLAICPTKDHDLKPDEALFVTLTDISTELERAPKSILVSLEHLGPTAKSTMYFERLHPGPKDLPESLGWDGGVVYISKDGGYPIRTRNRHLDLRNTSSKPWFEGEGWLQQPTFTLQFNVAEQDEDFALTTPQDAADIDVTAPQNFWTSSRDRAGPLWTLKPDSVNNRRILGGNESVRFRIDEVLTYFCASPQCGARLVWRNVPGYRDSYRYITFFKAPPPPTVERFEAKPCDADVGGEVSLSWLLYGGEGELKVDGVHQRYVAEGEFKKVVRLADKGKAKYEIICSRGNTSETRAVTVRTGLPRVTSFIASTPAHLGNFELAWVVENARECTLHDGDGVQLGGPHGIRARVTQRMPRSPNNYILRCHGYDGQMSEKTIEVKVRMMKINAFTVDTGKCQQRDKTGPFHAITTIKWETEGAAKVRLVDLADPGTSLSEAATGELKVDLVKFRGRFRLELVGDSRSEVLAYEKDAEATDYPDVKARYGWLDGLLYSAGHQIKRWHFATASTVVYTAQTNRTIADFDVAADYLAFILDQRDADDVLGGAVNMKSGDISRFRDIYERRGERGGVSINVMAGTVGLCFLSPSDPRSHQYVWCPLDIRVSSDMKDEGAIVAWEASCHFRMQLSSGAHAWFSGDTKIWFDDKCIAEVSGFVVDFTALDGADAEGIGAVFWIEVNHNVGKLWTATAKRNPVRLADKKLFCIANRKPDSQLYGLTSVGSKIIWVEAEGESKVLYGFINNERTRLIALDGPVKGGGLALPRPAAVEETE